MRKYSIFLFIVITSFWVNAQEVIINSDFVIRDFIVKKDSIFFIKKRYIRYYNQSLKDTVSNNKYFIGGYGLKLYNDSNSNQIISVSNEFVRKVSSLRFYNKSLKKIENVFYYEEGKSINALIIPELNFAIMSLNNNRIIVVDYSAKPTFKVVHNIYLKSLARGIYFKDNNLFYATDLGNIYKYNFITKNSKLIYSCGELITDLKFYKNNIIFTTINGKIIKYNRLNEVILNVEIENNFVLNTLLFGDKLLCGTFKGLILVVDLKDMKITEQLNYHKRSVLKITKGKRNEFYSSSIDKTIKKWIIE